MSKAKGAGEIEYIRTEIKSMGTLAKTFEEKAKVIELAMKFEALNLKLRPPTFGKGFDEGADDDEF